MKKIILRIVLGFVLVMVLAVVAGFLLIDQIAKSGVEKGASYALGVETTVKSIDVRLFDGQIIMDDLNISNPEGFTSPHLVHTGRVDVQVDLGSLSSETVEVSKFELDGLEMHIEQKLSGSNVSQIMDNLKRLSKDTDKDKQKDKPTSKGPSKQVIIKRILIENVVAHFHLLAGPALKVEVPTIELTNVSSDGSGGVAGQLTSQIFSAVLEAVLKSAKGIVPADFLEGLDKEFLELGTETLEQAGKILEESGLEESLKETGETIEKGLGELGEGLFGSEKKPADRSE